MLLRLCGFGAPERSAQGAWITDSDGDVWLDFGSYGVHLLGHRHPRIVDAARQQLDRMGLGSRVLGNEEATRCGEALLATLPTPLDRVVLANGGAEATEHALKIAMLATGRHRFVAMRGAYHGRSAGALALSDAPGLHERLSVATHTTHVEPGDEEALDQVLRTQPVAAVFVEPVQGEGGIRPISPGDLQTARDLCTAHGTLLVLDEIQCGLGRCGHVWRSAGRHVVPDLVLAGKTLGGGLVALSAVAASSAVGRAALDPVVHASSCAAGALAARVGREVIEVVQSDGWLPRVRELGARLLRALQNAAPRISGIRAIRGEGLMAGIELDSPGRCGQAILECARRRLLVTFCLRHPHVLRVFPPAVCDDSTLDEGVQRLIAALEVAAQEEVPCPP